MGKVRVNASVSYDVVIAPGLIKSAGQLFRQVTQAKHAFLVSDDNVFKLYGSALSASLEGAGFNVFSFVFEHGEKSKTLSTYEKIVEFLCLNRASRSDMLVALGGGVTGDMAGFAAATYQRGMDFVQVPTSLLAAVDSSVGGKTGVDLKGGKNQVGCFYKPLTVLCDTDALITLPDDEYQNGCAEVIKYGVLGSRELFDSLNKTPVRENYPAVIEKCVMMKRDLVEQDERDTGARMLLNLGHTLGHAAEKLSGYTIPHGRAVAMGLAEIARVACAHSVCAPYARDEIISTLKKYSLPTEFPFGADETARACSNDKKSSRSLLRLVLPETVGSCRIQAMDKALFAAYLKAGGMQ